VLTGLPTGAPTPRLALRRTPRANCADGFRVSVRGANIKRVEFRLDGRRIGGRGKAAASQRQVDVQALPGKHTITARVTFKDGARSQTDEARLQGLRRRPAPRAPRAVAVHRVIRRAGGAFALAIALAAGPSPAGAAAPAEAAAASATADQALVVLLGDHVARTRPSLSARRVRDDRGPPPATRPGPHGSCGSYDTATGPPVCAWLQDRCPGRPNTHTGGSRPIATRQTATGWSIDVRGSAALALVAVSLYGRVVRALSHT
jgi:hypothetical protein